MAPCAYATLAIPHELRSSQCFLGPLLFDSRHPHLLQEGLSTIHDYSWLVSIMDTQTIETQNKEIDADLG